MNRYWSTRLETFTIFGYCCGSIIVVSEQASEWNCRGGSHVPFCLPYTVYCQRGHDKKGQKGTSKYKKCKNSRQEGTKAIF